MSETFLDKIVLKTLDRVTSLKNGVDGIEIRSRAERVRGVAKPHLFRSALQRSGRVNIIAEIKRASPSKGVINANIDVKEVVHKYESGGAAAISVLTESEFFGGSLDDLRIVSETAGIPVLRKDFIVDEYQIYEAAAAGADAVLLIVAALSELEIEKLLHVAQNDLGMDVLVEVHNSVEMEVAKRIGAQNIGVNNRDLRSHDVSLDVSRRLINERPKGSLMVAESGISCRGEIDELRDLGFDAFLIGETLMRSHDAAAELRSLVGLPKAAI
ncbi:indole-3-glycerol phosphate synthase TrpC [soil metagenome]